MAVDISRESDGVWDLLPPEVSKEVWSGIQEESVIQRACTQTPLAGTGKTVPVITSDPVPTWPGETDQRTPSRGTVGAKAMKPYTASLLVPFSNEFKRDADTLYSAMVRRFPKILAKSIDNRCLFGPAPGDDFDTLAAIATVDVTQGADNAAYNGLLDAMSLVADTDDGEVSSWLLSTKGRLNFMRQLDANDQPVFVSDTNTVGGVGALVGTPVFKSKAVGDPGGVGVPRTFGFGGDWENASWGIVDGIRYSETDQASIQDGTVVVPTSGVETVEIPNMINLFQQNMFAVKVEIEFGFRVRDAGQFVRLVGPDGDA